MTSPNRCRRCGIFARNEYCTTCEAIARERLPVEVRVPRRESWGDELDDDVADMVERGEHSRYMDADFDAQREEMP